MNFPTKQRGWILPLLATTALLVACGSAPTGDPTGQTSEEISSASGSETTAEGAKLPGRCNVVWTGRRLLQTGLCVLDDGTDDTPACILVDSPQCEKFKDGNASICACGASPDCTYVDDVKCGPVTSPQ
jgi:hypothetical protein